MIHRARRDLGTESGFTLMEVLVALVILGMLFLALTRGIRFGIEAWNTQSRLVALRDQLDDTDRALRLLLSQIKPASQSDSAQLVGQSDRLAFRTELPTAVSLLTRNVDATLYVDDQKRLILAWKLYFHEQPLRPPAAPTKTELLAGVQLIKLQYWGGNPGQGGNSGWLDSWQSAAPPALIKVHLAFPKGDPRHWPDIIVAPAVQHLAE